MSRGEGRNRAAIAAMDELFAAAFFKLRRAAKIIEQSERGINAFTTCAPFYSIEMILCNGVTNVPHRAAQCPGIQSPRNRVHEMIK